MQPGRPAFIYLDSDAIIRSVEGDTRSLDLLIGMARKNLARLYTSELTLAEVLVGPLKQSQLELTVFYEDMLAPNDYLSVMPVERSILRRSAEIRASIGNRGADAIHIATAIACGCSFFISSDKRIHLPPGLSRHGIDQVQNLDFRT